MHTFLRFSGKLLVSRWELGGIGASALVFWLWGRASGGPAGFAVVLFFLALSYICTLAGRLCLGAVRVIPGPGLDFPTVFLFGFFFVNSALFFLALATPLGLARNALVVVLGVAAWGLAAGPASVPAPAHSGPVWPGLACTLISLFAATLWSGDSIRPFLTTRGAVVVKPWIDSFQHACVVRMFRDAHGPGSLEHIMMSGRPAPVYHYASYATPALLAAVTDTPCYLAFTSFQAPLGIVLTGLAAFALVRSWWGPGAGLAATVALLLLPDASRYGLGNAYLSYDWLQQIAPGGAYGVALLAISWLLLFEAGRSGRAAVFAGSFLAAGLVLGYKAHLFVANAFLIWAAPSFLACGARPLRRVAWFSFALGSFLAVVSLARHVPSAPLLRLDGSGLKTYLGQLAFNLSDGPAKRFLAVTPETPWLPDLGRGIVHLLLGTFGAFGPACLALVFPMVRRREDGDSGRTRTAVVLFPIVVVVNYLVMSLGLAPDEQSLTGAHELQHRPLVWAYFAVAAWTGGAFHETLLKGWLQRSRRLRALLLPALAGLLCVPLVLGVNVQDGPGWGQQLTRAAMPVDLFECARFLRERGRPGDVIQDSARDPVLALSALSERPEFAVDFWDPRFKTLLAGRLEALRGLERIADRDQLFREASAHRLRWYVLHPGTGARLDWPRSFLAEPAFVSGGYRVYHFPGPRGP